MAVGDVVSDYDRTVDRTFQPAATVQVCITTVLAYSTANFIRGRGDIDTSTDNFYFGTADGSTSTNDTVSQWNNINWRWFVDNNSYLYFSADSGYSGIQTQ